ncbi:hypothetical protein OAT67_07305 [Bacteriovoracaceae bacterium]|nr:hypothetical protein [Bacteriovoracaceae bacterium]
MKSCKEVSQLLASDKELGVFDKLSLKLHFSVCKVCRTYKQQQEAITKVYKERLKKKNTSISETAKKVEDSVIKKYTEE